MKIGPERPSVGVMATGIYTGEDPALLGHTALISIAPSSDPRPPGWFVQVDAMTSDYSHGWWWFTASDWREL